MAFVLSSRVPLFSDNESINSVTGVDVDVDVPETCQGRLGTRPDVSGVDSGPAASGSHQRFSYFARSLSFPR